MRDVDGIEKSDETTWSLLYTFTERYQEMEETPSQDDNVVDVNHAALMTAA